MDSVYILKSTAFYFGPQVGGNKNVSNTCHTIQKTKNRINIKKNNHQSLNSVKGQIVSLS